jgi:NTE family protein
VLKALEENKIHIDLISGASAGSMIACLYSVGYTTEEIKGIAEKYAKSFVLDFSISGIYSYLKSLATLKPKKIDGFISGDKIKNIFDSCCEQKGCIKIKETKIPIAIPCVNINTSKVCMFVSNKSNLTDSDDVCYDDDIDLAEAVRASSSYPVVFKPYVVKGSKMVDGGIRENMPVDVLKRMGANRILAVNLGYAGQADSEMDDILEIAIQCIDIMAYQLTEGLADKADFVLKPKVYDVNMFDVKRIPECIQRGYDAAISAMPAIKRALYH